MLIIKSKVYVITLHTITNYFTYFRWLNILSYKDYVEICMPLNCLKFIISKNKRG